LEVARFFTKDEEEVFVLQFKLSWATHFIFSFSGSVSKIEMDLLKVDGEEPNISISCVRPGWGCGHVAALINYASLWSFMTFRVLGAASI